MKAPEFTIGDKVSHFREAGNTGTVIAVRKSRFPFRHWIYDVQWREGVLHVPMTRDLRLATDEIPSPTRPSRTPPRMACRQ